MRTRILPLLIASLAVALAGARPAAAKIEVRATLTPTRIGIGELAMLTVEVTNDSLSSIRFSPHFELDNFELGGGVQQMSDLHYGSGGLSRTFRVSWPLRALHVGTAAVRKIALEVNGTVLELTDREVQVQRQPTLPPPDAQPEEDPFAQFFGRFAQPLRRLREPRQPALFLRQEVEPKQAVVGQQLVYSIYLYARREVDVASPSELPKFKGFWVRDIPQPQHLRADFVQIDGDTYSRVLVLRRALFALRPGRFEIEPASFDFAVREMDNEFFGPPIESSEPVHLTTPPVSVEVQALPAEPPGFTGAVGSVTLLASVAPKELRVGEAATLTLALSGEGNLHTIEDPALAPQPGIELSAPQHEGRDEVQGDTVRGDRIWKFSVLPKRAGRFTLEAPPVPYYDPKMHEYRIAAAEPLILNVLPAEAKTATEGDPDAANGPNDPNSAAPQSAPWLGARWRQRLPWGIAALSTLVAFVAFAGLLRRRAHSASDVLGAPPPQAPRVAEAASALRQALDRAASEGRASAFAQQTETAWRAFLETAYALPPATPAARWADLLAAAGRVGANGAIRADLERLLEDLRFLRYAPQLAAIDEVRAEARAASARLVQRLGAG